MEVILTSKIKNLGDIGEIVNVKPGYARNFLFPREKAIYNSPINKAKFNAEKKDIEKKEKELISSANNSKKEFNNKEVVIIENASDDGRLYGSVNATTIISKLKEVTNLSLVKSDIKISQPIKEIGIYNIKVNLHSEVAINISLIVTRNELEIKTLKEDLKNKNKNPEETEIETVAEEV
jgi:large subunit ribosomal protein L9